jgi:hypothetical protein
MSPRVAFHIGYRKTASTWFQRVALPSHPAIGAFVTTPVEQPFLREIIVRPDRSFDVERARRLFDERAAELDVPEDGIIVVSAERLSGHLASGSYDALRIAERLHDVVPDARVFAVVREQTAMLESEYQQLVREGSPARVEALLDEGSHWRTVGFDLARYDYDRLADAYAALFGADNIRLFELSALTKDPRGFLDDVAAYLEIEPWPELSDEVLHRRVNAGVPRRLLGARRFMNHFERSLLNPYPLLSVRPFWQLPLGVLATRLPPSKRPFFDAATRARLQDRYRRCNEQLAERYGVVFG